MFKKTNRRNFRQRKDESSEEDEGEKGLGGSSENEPQVHSSKLLAGPRRGISCSSKPNATPPRQTAHSDRSDCSEAEDSEQPVWKPQPKSCKDPSHSQTLSFSEDKDGADECDFKVKRSVSKAVIFQARKREESPIKLTSTQPDVKNVDLNERSDGSTGSSAEDIPPDSDSEVQSISSRASSSSTKAQKVNVPDAKKIRAVKEQRRRARAQRDYIPLEGDRESTPGSGDKEENQSDEERDSDDEPDDHERRIQFAPKSKTVRERMAEKMGIISSEESDSDSQKEEDQHLWEEQQIRKGVKRHQKQSRERNRPLRQKKMVDIPETLPPVSIDIIKKRITGKLESLKEVHRAREAELRRMQLDMESAKNSLENLENYPADEQLRFYRSMNVFTQNLLECLSEKMMSINSVELDMHSLYIDQAESLMSQRRQAIQQESTRLQQLTYSNNAHGNGESLVKTDPFKDNAYIEDDCVQADLEPTAEQEAELQSKRADILKRSQEMFSDVQEDFCDVRKVLSRFNEWRVSFSESYNNAYIGLCLPKLLAPLIRHQLIGWNPLKAEGEDFEALPWYSAVENFCHGQGYEESENTDKKTLPAIIEKTILPKMQGFVELVWDPLSLQQSQCLASLCKRIQEDYSVFDGERCKPVKAFMEAVIQRMRSAVDNDVFIPLYPKTCLDDKASPQFQFQNRQFWCAVKLLGNIALWDGLVAESVLKELMLDKLLTRYLMMALLNESSPQHVIQKCKKVTDCFPKSWFMDLNDGSTIPQLQNFSKNLVQATHLFCKQNKDTASCSTQLVKCGRGGREYRHSALIWPPESLKD
ncbi:intron Large complex component GCFC2 isoform X2 [Salminus brasiliensis]|uniref:intron Large complex component GCFC2 isoform X2 n=1 Tax=Salminus brasiliensis TaxID=930266 RepID=UPI003B830DA3